MNLVDKVVFDRKYNQFFTITSIVELKCEGEVLKIVKLGCENPSFFITQTQFTYDFLMREINSGAIDIVVGYEKQFFTPFEKQKLFKFLRY